MTDACFNAVSSAVLHLHWIYSLICSDHTVHVISNSASFCFQFYVRLVHSVTAMMHHHSFVAFTGFTHSHHVLSWMYTVCEQPCSTCGSIVATQAVWTDQLQMMKFSYYLFTFSFRAAYITFVVN
jgi:hypothetical protein